MKLRLAIRPPGRLPQCAPSGSPPPLHPCDPCQCPPTLGHEPRGLRLESDHGRHDLQDLGEPLRRRQISPVLPTGEFDARPEFPRGRSRRIAPTRRERPPNLDPALRSRALRMRRPLRVAAVSNDPELADEWQWPKPPRRHPDRECDAPHRAHPTEFRVVKRTNQNRLGCVGPAPPPQLSRRDLLQLQAWPTPQPGTWHRCPKTATPALRPIAGPPWISPYRPRHQW